jgi:hypothetical protein
MKININLSKLNSAIESALFETTIELSIASQNALKVNRWRWSRATVRRSGEVAGSPRNIIDTGTLYRSQQVKIGNKSASISYAAKYAQIVHRDRPWLRQASEEVDILGTFTKNLRKNLR